MATIAKKEAGEAVQQKECKSPEQFNLETEQEKTEQKRCEVKIEEFRIQQEDERTKQRVLEVEKSKLDLEKLQTRKKKRICVIDHLSILVRVFSLALIGGGIWVFCSINEIGNPTYNRVRLIFGYLMMVSFVVLIIFLCFMLKSLVSHSEEE
ncbi:MAG: hypothetical protein NT166_03735 [Candidatus Aminicenantes bacterium]|nr:hypothetical protein [Candidatus Aminicenantes bacterium]